MFDYNLGKHCSDPYCHQKDFLPFTCDHCQGVFCADHREEHNCAGLPALNMQSIAPTCPICSNVLPKRFPTESNDLVVNRHLDSGECGKSTSKTIVPIRSRGDHCHYKSCSKHTTVYVNCRFCGDKFCLDHRGTEDHECRKMDTTITKRQHQQQQQQQVPQLKFNTSLSGKLHMEKLLNRNKTITPSSSTNNKKPVKVSLKKRDPNTTIQFVNTAQSAVIPTNRPNLERKDQTHVPVFLPLDKYQPMYMYFPATSSVGKVIDMICQYAKLDFQNKNGDKLRLFNLSTGRILPLNKQFRELTESGEVREGVPLVFEYVIDGATMISDSLLEELQQYLHTPTRQTLLKTCGGNIRAFTNSVQRSSNIYVH